MIDDKLLLLLAGSPLLYELAKVLFARFVGKADAAAKKVEEQTEGKLDLVLKTVQRMEVDLASFKEKQANQEGSLAKVSERIEGVSNNHGPRLALVEERVTRLEERLPKGKR